MIDLETLFYDNFDDDNNQFTEEQLINEQIINKKLIEDQLIDIDIIDHEKLYKDYLSFKDTFKSCQDIPCLIEKSYEVDFVLFILEKVVPESLLFIFLFFMLF